MRTLRSIAPLLSSCLAVLALGACQREPAPRVEQPRPVRSVVVQPEALQGALVLPAEIRPRIEVRYGFRVGGKIAERTVSAGDAVRPGQMLARLDPQDALPVIASAKASLEAARTDAKLAEADLQRQRSLRERNFISQASLERQQAVHDAARSRVEAAEAQLRQASNALDFGVLRADVAGRVIALDAEAGQVVAAGQSVVRVAKAGEIEALVNVPEKSLAAARAQQRWRVLVPAAGDREIAATVREIGPVADAASRTWAMRLSLSGNLDGVELGMTASATGASGSGTALLLPVSALVSLDANPTVWVYDAAGQTVRAVKVKTGGFVGERVRIVEGVAAGDRVITAGANLVKAGQKVRLIDGDGAAR